MVFLEPGISSNIILKGNYSWIQNNDKRDNPIDTDDEETSNEMTTHKQQINDPPTMPTPNSNTNVGRINKYRRKNKKYMFTLVGSYFVGWKQELDGVMELFYERIDKKNPVISS